MVVGPSRGQKSETCLIFKEHTYNFECSFFLYSKRNTVDDCLSHPWIMTMVRLK